jgi:error-prone DNA polymerase
VPYAELHCHSNFSFLDGASHPEELAEEAHRLGLTALAVTDHNGLYGVVRFAEAARAVGLPTVFGSEITVSHRLVRNISLCWPMAPLAMRVCHGH